MHITVAKFGGSENVLTVEIASDLSLKDLKAVIEAESDFGIKAEDMSLYYEGKFRRKKFIRRFFDGFSLGKILQDENQTLEQCKFHDYDLVTCQRTRCESEERFYSFTYSLFLAADPLAQGATTMPRRNFNRKFCLEFLRLIYSN